jgi:hypothetical protein
LRAAECRPYEDGFDLGFDFGFDFGFDVDFDVDFHVLKRPPASADKNPTVFLVGFFSADAIMGGQQGGGSRTGRYGAEPRPQKKNLTLIF